MQILSYYVNSNMLFRIAQRTNLRFIAAAAKGPFLLVNLPENKTLADVLFIIQTFKISLMFLGVLHANCFYTATRLSSLELSKKQILSVILNKYFVLLILLYNKVYKMPS